MHIQRFAIAFLLLTGLFATPHPARAAESYDNCVGTSTTLPTTISTQGVWCMKKDLATSIANGSAIEIAANNVTIDCNDFKLGGLAAGNNSAAIGIHATDCQNATIRHCNIRGFYSGIQLGGGGGHLVEDNRLDNNLYVGIYVSGVNGLVRHNRIYDTGGSAGNTRSFGISTSADIFDNVVEGVFTAGTTTYLYGIQSFGSGTRVDGNQVAGLVLNGGGSAYGIQATAEPQTLVDNSVAAVVPGTAGYGIYGRISPATGISGTHCARNMSIQFDTPWAFCTDDGGNGLH